MLGLSHYIGQLRRRDEAAQSQIRALKPGLHEAAAELVTRNQITERQKRTAPVAAADSR